MPRATTDDRFSRRPGGISGLATALLAFIIAPLILLLALGAWFGLQALAADVEERKQEEIELIARAIRLPLSYSLEMGRVGAVRESLNAAFQFDRVYGAHVFDTSGRLIASAGAGRSEQPPSPERVATEGADEDARGTFERVRGEEVYNYFAPLTDTGGRVVGMLQVSRQGTEFRQDLARLRLWTVGLLLAVGATVTIIILLAHRTVVGRPIAQLVDAMQRIAYGERGFRTRLNGPGELCSLRDGLNAMLASIERSERELEARREREQALERDLRHSQKLAAIGALSTGIAHELGTPLSVVDGRAQRLLRGGGDAERTAREARAIRDEVERMGHTIRQLMDFAGRNPIRLSPEPLDRLVELAATTFENSSETSGVRIAVVPDRSVPVVEVDRNRMLRALLNLLRNAAQAAGEGGRVAIGWQSGDTPSVYVDDDGPGVPDELRSRLFEPFFTTKSVADGTGLGLAVVHGTVEDHGARILVEHSPELGGARFRIVFPVSGTEGA